MRKTLLGELGERHDDEIGRPEHRQRRGGAPDHADLKSQYSWAIRADMAS